MLKRQKKKSKWQFITYRLSQYHAVADVVPLRVLPIEQGLQLPMSG
ncbi:hypothetical protein ENHYD8BJ_40049 [Enhydrobacter sp. 8BJ]|nr:hypothetical protein ENHYD8BJ_40049 [Enhydrobacter sp. 8BJ]